MKKDTKNLKSSDIDKAIDELKINWPYIKKLPNGLWDIFDGNSHCYCGDGTKKQFEETIKKLGEDKK